MISPIDQEYYLLMLQCFCEKPFSYDYHIFKNMINLKPQIILVNHSYNIPPHLDYHEQKMIPFIFRCISKITTKNG